MDLEQALVDMPVSARTEATQHLQTLKSLQRQISSASPAMLNVMRADITTAVMAIQATVHHARTTASAEAVALLSEVAHARQTVSDLGRDYYERKLLDPYLTFGSPEDEAAYRKRERDNEQAYRREHAKETPEGDRRAAAIIEQQLLDAGAHGADASPDYPAMLDRVREAKTALRGPAQERPAESAIAAKEPTASKFNLSNEAIDDVAATLQAAGVTTLELPGNAGKHGLADSARPPGAHKSQNGRS